MYGHFWIYSLFLISTRAHFQYLSALLTTAPLVQWYTPAEETGVQSEAGHRHKQPTWMRPTPLWHKLRAPHREPSFSTFLMRESSVGILTHLALDAHSLQPPRSHMYHIPEEDEQYSGLKAKTQLCCHLLCIMKQPGMIVLQN